MKHSQQQARGDAERKVEIREEQLRPETQRVKAGDVEISKEVVSERQTKDVPLTREEVEVDYHPVNRAPSDRPVGEDETVHVPVHNEEITDVRKETVVTGEIDVRKRQQHVGQVSDTVRREKPHVEKEGNLTVRGTS